MGLPGRWVPLSLPRRFVGDLLWAGRRLPVVAFERAMDLAAVAAARRRVAPPPPWVVLFAKAYAVVAARRPELRRTYLPYPWPHLWEAGESVASIAVERDYRGEPGVFFGFVRAPDQKPITELARLVREWRHKPVEEITRFRRQVLVCRLPRLVRRFLWWVAMNWSGRLKAHNLGTFGVSVTAGEGATAQVLPTPLATTLNYGVFRPDGTLDVRLHFDHRVIDGVPVARALADLEFVLQTEIRQELEKLAARPRGETANG